MTCKNTSYYKINVYIRCDEQLDETNNVECNTRKEKTVHGRVTEMTAGYIAGIHSH